MARKSGNKQQAEELRKLVEAVNKTNTLLAQQASKRSTDAKAADDKRKKAANARKERAVIAKGMLAVNKITAAATGAMKDALNSSLKLQEQSLGRGMNLSQVIEASRSQQDQMVGSLTGFGNAVQIGYEQFESGLKSSNAATNELALYTKLTGGNSKKLLKSMAKLTRGMDLSGDQESLLMSSIQGLSQNFGITSEELVDSLKGLDKEMRTYKLLGIGAEITQAGATLTAAMGVQAGSLGTELLATLTSAEGMYTAAALGVTQERLALLKGEGNATVNALNMVEKAGKIAKDRIDQLVSGGMDPAVAIQQLEKTLGKGVGQAALAYEQIKKEADRNGRSIEEQFAVAKRKAEIDQEFVNSWQNFKSQVFSPLVETVTKFTSGLLQFAAQNKPIMVKIAQGLVLVAGLISAYLAAQTVGKLAGAAGGLASKAGGGIASFGKGFMKLFVNGIRGILPALGAVLKTAVASIPGIGLIVIALGTLIYIFRDEIGGFLMGIWEAVKPLMQAIWGGLKEVWQTILGVLEPLYKAVSLFGQILWKVSKMAAKFLWSYIGPVLKGVWKAVKAVTKGIWGAIKWVWGHLKSFFDILFSPFVSIFNFLYDILLGIGDWLGIDAAEEEVARRAEAEKVKPMAEQAAANLPQLREQLAREREDGPRNQRQASRRAHEHRMEVLMERIAEQEERIAEATEHQTGAIETGNYDRKNQDRPHTQHRTGSAGYR
jgi:hypothetical protein